MPFVTEFNYSRILKKLVGDLPKNFHLWRPYKKPIQFLSKLDKINLYYFEEFCKNPLEQIKKIYAPFELSDTFEYVYEGNVPAYHKFENCNRLISDYTNFKVPKQIKEKGGSAVEEFRHWFKENERLFLKDPAIYQMRLLTKYKIKSDLTKVDYRNSGVQFKENLTLEIIETRIESILKNESKYFVNHPKYHEIFKIFSNKTYLAFQPKQIEHNNTKYSDTDLKSILREYHFLFVQPIIYYLKEHFKMYYKADIEMDEEVFKYLKFNPCQHCYSDTYKTHNEDKIEELITKFGDHEFPIEPGIFYPKKEHDLIVAFIYCRVIKCVDSDFFKDSLGMYKRYQIEYISRENQIRYTNTSIYKQDIPEIKYFRKYLTKIEINDKTKSVNYRTYAHEL